MLSVAAGLCYIAPQLVDGNQLDRTPTDEALVAGICQRDSAALGQLYDRYASPIYALARHLLGPADAEEVVQDVFLTLWHKAEQYNPTRSAFGAWFMAIARHRTLDELRRRGAQQRLRAAEDVERVLAGAADPAAGIEEQVWQHESGAAVLRALQRLPEEQRRVLVLGYFGGLSHAAMAQRLGWPLGTVKKRVQLGLRKLRGALGQYAPHAADGDGHLAPAGGGRDGELAASTTAGGERR